MPNPGSPQQMQQMQQSMPGMPKGTMVSMLLVLVIMFVVMGFRTEIGGALNIVFQYIDFGGQWPVFTLVIAGLIMISLSTVLRGLLTDPISQAKSQQIQREFQKELRKARLENNLFKLKKLTEQQPMIMSKSMESSMGMMKIMPISMLVIIPIYAWVWYFLDFTAPAELLNIHMPWGDVNIMGSLWFFPIWIIVYTLISLPIGQLENRIVRYILLNKRLKELDGIDFKS